MPGLSKAIRCSLWIVITLAAMHASSAFSNWGSDYFPNVSLTTHEGRQVRFFDDVIAGKVVAVNFMFTSCVDSCPLETAQLTKVQNILGDRLGKDVFLYSISIDPDTDTPEVLAAYRRKFGARWTFLTGAEADIILLRKKLGLYIDEIQDDSRNHNVSMIIGNQATGQWMKRSPFENPYVLADQIGDWLTGWEAPTRNDGYVDAPQLREISDGEKLFRTRCVICHSIGTEAVETLGPNLRGVTRRRDRTWLQNWLRAPDRMLAVGDPLATALYKQFNEVAMPNLRLNQVDVEALLRYLEQETERLESAPKTARKTIAVTNVWIREAHPGTNRNAGYLTIVNRGSDEVELIGIESPTFDKVEVHEMTMVGELPRMRQVSSIPIPAGGSARLIPGSKHLMLFGPSEAVTIGHRVDLTLTFDKGERQTISAIVVGR